jgi:exopolysaccharide biosynthesis polyprenyl glycosylphosphotransferase
MRKIRILYVITLAEVGGAQTHLQSLIEKLDKERFEITIACSFTGPLVDNLRDLGVRVHELPNLKREISPANDIKTLIHLIRFCRKEKFDILHAHSSKAGFLGRVAGYLARVPVIIFSVHGFAFTPESTSVLRKIFMAIEFFCGRISSKVICVSSKDMEYAVKEGIIPADRISRIANGVNIERFAKAGDRQKIRNEFGFSDGEIVVGMVTRLVDAKGCREFIQSAADLTNKYSHVRFLLVGEGPEHDKYSGLKDELKLGNRLILTGVRDDIPDILVGIDIFTLPSYTEALPYAVIEAMSAGKAVIATSVGGIPELITDRKEGLLIEPKDQNALNEKIDELVNDSNLRESLGQAAKKKIEDNYFLEKTVNQTTSLYRNILGDVREKLENKIPIVFGFCDLFMLHFSIILAFVFRFRLDIPAVNFATYKDYIFSISVIGFLCFYFLGLYDRPQESIYESVAFPTIFKSMTLVFMTLVLVRFLNKDYFDLPRPVLVMSWLIAILMVNVTRRVVAHFFWFPQTHKRVLVVGTGEEIEDLIIEINKRTHLGYEIMGFIEDDIDGKEPSLLNLKYLGKPGEIFEVVKNHQIDLVISGFPKSRSHKIIERMIQYEDLQLEIDLIPTTFDLVAGKVTTKLIGDIPLVSIPNNRYRISRSIMVKNILDKVVAFLLFLLFLPLLIIIAIIVKLTSKGSVLYKQVRVGRDEREFTIYKYRTMVENAEEQTGPTLADSNDWRITMFGRFLRRYSLDELPQLFNVLKGDMSLVGPRPERPNFVREYIQKYPIYRERFKMKPGMTGLAQVNGTYHTKFYTKLKYDLLYIYSYSLFRDLLIIIDTIKLIGAGKKA